VQALLETISEHRCFEGVQGFYRHASQQIGLPMRFSVYQPPQARRGPVPVLFLLAGLTGSEETFMLKAGAQRLAARHGLLLVSCDTSPRQSGIPGESEDWEVGAGAGFYLNATQAPWAQYYRMHDYVVHELRATVLAHFPAQDGRLGICGHSMGGHGALTLALRNPQVFRSVSAFAPICSPTRVPWGHKAFERYLGSDRATWASYDAVELLRSGGSSRFPEILVDQGLEDKYLHTQLLPEQLESACNAVGQRLRLRRHAGYDHGYFFIQSFIDDHLEFHAAALDAVS
jgi:S-formylglutathione hydrolase